MFQHVERFSDKYSREIIFSLFLRIKIMTGKTIPFFFTSSSSHLPCILQVIYRISVKSERLYVNTRRVMRSSTLSQYFGGNNTSILIKSMPLTKLFLCIFYIKKPRVSADSVPRSNGRLDEKQEHAVESPTAHRHCVLAVHLSSG